MAPKIQSDSRSYFEYQGSSGRAYQLVILLSVAVFLPSCDLFMATECPADLRFSIEPVQASVRVGQQVQVTATALGCGGSEILENNWRWESGDTTIARVAVQDTRRARVTGVRVGSTTIRAIGQGIYGGSIDMTVNVAAN
jgi:hypothetical protein